MFGQMSRKRVMHGGVSLVLAGVPLLLAAGCGGDDAASDKPAASTSASRGEPIVIHAKLRIATTENAEPIATGKILARSELNGSPFCASGTIRDTHASRDPKMTEYLIDRKITCPEGTVRIGLKPEVGAESQGRTQKGSWTIVSGTGAFERLHGSGKGETVYSSNPSSPAQETLTGTTTR